MRLDSRPSGQDLDSRLNKSKQTQRQRETRDFVVKLADTYIIAVHKVAFAVAYPPIGIVFLLHKFTLEETLGPIEYLVKYRDSQNEVGRVKEANEVHYLEDRSNLSKPQGLEKTLNQIDHLFQRHEGELYFDEFRNYNDPSIRSPDDARWEFVS